MKNKSFLFLTFIVLSASCTSSQQSFKNPIALETSCHFKNRKVVDTFKDQIAELSFQNELYIITFNDRKFIACNLPAGIESKSILISGDILEIYPTERLMGSPLRVTKAYYK